MKSIYILAALALSLVLIGTGMGMGGCGSTFEAAFGTSDYQGPDTVAGYNSFLESIQAEINAIISGGPFQDGSLAGNDYGHSSIAPNLDAMIAGG